MPLTAIVAHETLTLYAGKAAYWARRETLLLADPHFGKAAAFRTAGVPVPATTAADLGRLDHLLALSAARRLLILGDFFHARSGRSAQTMTQLRRWRRRHPDLDIVLVRGNHDRHAGDPPPGWNIHGIDGPLLEPPFAFVHDPDDLAIDPVTPPGYVLAGHVHPAVRLRDIDGSTLRAPCFWFGPQRGLLPAFGSFLGCHTIRPRRGDQLYLLGPGHTPDDSQLVHIAA